MNNVVDFHTHILPNLDDGSRSVEHSLEMLRSEYEQGVSRIVLTPHFYANHDTPNRFLERRALSETRLVEATKNLSQIPKIHIGAEVRYFDGMSDFEKLKDLAIKGTNYILIEMPLSNWSERMLVELDDIRQKRNLNPIMAHVDRYVSPKGSNWCFDCLSELSVMIQVNASFYLNIFTRNKALRLLSDKKIHLLGSDCHDMKARKPNLKAALSVIHRRLGEESISYINSQENKVIPFEE